MIVFVTVSVTRDRKKTTIGRNEPFEIVSLAGE
jgi:hypothetical protein